MLLKLIEAQALVVYKTHTANKCSCNSTEGGYLSFWINRALRFLCAELNFAKIA